jgi:chemotaxis protein methyltransferase CheR
MPAAVMHKLEKHEPTGLCNSPVTPSAAEQGTRISEYEFRLLRDYIHDYCGIFFDDSKMATLANRLMFRLKLLDIRTFSEYYNFLKYNPRSKEEMDDLIPHLTNNETYFFREMNQLHLFVSDTVGRIMNCKSGSHGCSIRIVSCGCSSGEEAYTIAMLLEDGGLYSKGMDISITGVDIDRKVLDKAAKGLYTSYSLRATDKSIIDKYFTKDGDKYMLAGQIRDKVQFVRGNLMDRGVLSALGSADVIFCRNVLIYFSDRSIREITDIFYNTLAPHGYLFLGHSESLTRVTDIFEPKRYPNAIIYSKKGA